MTVAFFSEGNWSGVVSRTHRNMRTDMAWMCALNAHHYYIHNTDIGVGEGYYDMGIIIVPKNNPNLDNVGYIRSRCKKLAVMQEGPYWYWQDWNVAFQFQYYGLLQSVDVIFAHNLQDRLYFEGLVPGKVVRVLRSLMIHDAIDIESLCNPDERTGVIIGGNFVSWYGGIDSYIIASEFECPIYAPSMGRKRPEESQIEDITYLPYIDWTSWITELSKRKYAVHLMRTHAAGTFALNCAYLGIPCIGYRGLDTQRLLHPHTTVDDGDLRTAREMAQLLISVEEFYQTCSTQARMRYHYYYSEEEFLKSFNNI